jgi:hypothetical protein
VTPRKAGRGFEVLGRVPVPVRAAEVWVHPDGKCAYLTTISDRVYAIDVSDPRAPRIVDSMMTDARLVNDVMTTEDGKYGVFSREGSSNRKDGIVVFDASDACHPKPIAEYTETVSGGVHSSFVYKGYVYLTDDATGSMRVIDIRDPFKPREVRSRPSSPRAARARHPRGRPGLLSYWNDGLIILDVGNGMKGGSAEKPVQVGQLKYDLNALYSRVDQMYGLGARGTHTSWRKGKYVFIADEVYASRSNTGLQDGNDLTWGRLQVVDVSNSTSQDRRMAEPTDGGCTTSGRGRFALHGELPGRGTGARCLRRAQGRLAAPGPRDVVDLHGRLDGSPPPCVVLLGRGGEERHHLLQRLQWGQDHAPGTEATVVPILVIWRSGV